MQQEVALQKQAPPGARSLWEIGIETDLKSFPLEPAQSLEWRNGTCVVVCRSVPSKRSIKINVFSGSSSIVCSALLLEQPEPGVNGMSKYIE